MPSISVEYLAFLGVIILIAFLSYGSQILFSYIEPSPLSQAETFTFNTLVCCILVCYIRACFASPGHVPIGWEPRDVCAGSEGPSDVSAKPRQRWCRKCKAVKPPRAHHCKSCGRYSPSRETFLYCVDFVLICFAQMYSQDGSPLSMDHQLCFPSYLSPFFSLPSLRRGFNVPARVLSLRQGVRPLGVPKHAKRKCTIRHIDHLSRSRPVLRPFPCSTGPSICVHGD